MTIAATPVNQIIVQQAVAEAIAEEMRRDPRVVMFGEGVATKRPELVAEFGADRVRNTPLAEAIIAGTAVGAAAMGLRPIVDLLFAPFLTLSMDALVNSAGKLRYLSGGQFSFPLVVLTMTGAGWGVGGQHNHNLEAMFVHAPGLKVVMPSSAADFKGLLKAAIRDDNPVLFFEHKRLYTLEGEVNGAPARLGEAAVVREGRDVTLVSAMKGVHDGLEAAGELQAEGVSVEVIDLRTIRPFDLDTVLGSVAKTNRLVVVEEGPVTGGWAGEVLASVTERGLGYLDDAWRIATPDTPIPYSPPLEDAFLPGAGRIAAEIRARLR